MDIDTSYPMQLIGISVLVFCLTAMLVMLLHVPAKLTGWVDIPGGRKQHDGHVPLVGGLAMFLAMLLATQAGLLTWSGQSNGFLFGALLLMVFGLLDDRFDMPPVAKLLGQGLAAWSLVGFGDTGISSLGDLLGMGQISLGTINLAVTLFAVIGLINALNFFDGLDGLAAGLSLIGLLLLTSVALLTNQVQLLPMLIACLAAVAGFWVFNMRFRADQRAFVFMGNAGSMLLGYTLAWFSVHLTQANDPVLPPIYALWFLALPLIETLSLIGRRLQAGRHPFQAGRDHIHHALMQAGLGHAKTVWTLLFIQLLLAGFGFVCWHAGVAEHLMFAAFLTLLLGYHAALLYGCKWIAWPKIGRILRDQTFGKTS
jgi:UDP-GlcNAc:undecaprenyl-phosphate GlcNAc-1-phosphate transferase